jgi:hypothetical protein
MPNFRAQARISQTHQAGFSAAPVARSLLGTPAPFSRPNSFPHENPHGRSDWVADVDSRRSHTGYIIMLNGGAVSWKSRRQDCVSISTSEAEYVAPVSADKKCTTSTCARSFVISAMPKPILHISTKSIWRVDMSENPVRRKFSRHIDIRCYFVRDMVAAGVIKLVPLRTHLMVADALTKSLSSPAHIKHRDIMLGHVPFSFAARTLRNFIGGGS